MKNNAKKAKLWVGGFLMAIALIFMVGCTEHGGFGGFGSGSGVARINGIYIDADDVGIYVAQAMSIVMWEYFEMTNEWEIDDWQAEFRDGKSFERVLREEAVRLAAFAVIYEEYAKQLGVTLSDEDIQMIDEHIEALIEMYGEEEFHEILESEGFRDVQHLADIFGTQVLFDILIEAIVENPEEFAKFEQYMPEEEDFSHVELLGAKHILANFNNFDSEEEAEEFAYEMLERALSGENFDVLVTTYGQDPGMMNFPNGYSFTAGEMVPEFEQATRELEIGEISGLVRTTFGIHIIKRIEPNMDDWFILANIHPQTLEDRKASAVFLGFQAMADNANIEFLPGLDNISID